MWGRERGGGSAARFSASHGSPAPSMAPPKPPARLCGRGSQALPGGYGVPPPLRVCGRDPVVCSACCPARRTRRTHRGRRARRFIAIIKSQPCHAQPVLRHPRPPRGVAACALPGRRAHSGGECSRALSARRSVLDAPARRCEAVLGVVAAAHVSRHASRGSPMPCGIHSRQTLRPPVFLCRNGVYRSRRQPLNSSFHWNQLGRLC